MSALEVDQLLQLKQIADELRGIARQATEAAKRLHIPPKYEREALESILRNVERLIKGGSVVTEEPDALEWIAQRCRVGLQRGDPTEATKS